MTAALDAAEEGLEVTLLEARRQLGGATRSFSRDGCWYDNGHHVVLGCCTSYLQLLSRLGVRDQIRLRPLDLTVATPDGRMARIAASRMPRPVHLLPSLLRYSHLPFRQRLRSLRVLAALARVDPSGSPSEDLALGAWLSERGVGERAVEDFWNVFVVGMLNAKPDDVSLQLAAMAIRTALGGARSGSDFGWSDVPLVALHGDPGAAALHSAGVDVQLGVDARGISQEGSTRIAVATGAGTLFAKTVVVAVPHHRVARLLPMPRASALLSSPIVNVAIRFDRRVMGETYLAAVRSPVQWVFDRTESSGATRGQVLVVSNSAATDDLRRPRDELVRRTVEGLRCLLPRARFATISDVVVTREPHATFLGAPGSRSSRAATPTTTPGVFIAGAWTDTGWPATMEGAVRSGSRAALQARSYLEGCPILLGAPR